MEVIIFGESSGWTHFTYFIYKLTRSRGWGSKSRSGFETFSGRRRPLCDSRWIQWPAFREEEHTQCWFGAELPSSERGRTSPSPCCLSCCLSWRTEEGSNILKMVRKAGSGKRRSISLQTSIQHLDANDSAISLCTSVTSPHLSSGINIPNKDHILLNGTDVSGFIDHWWPEYVQFILGHDLISEMRGGQSDKFINSRIVVIFEVTQLLVLKEVVIQVLQRFQLRLAISFLTRQHIIPIR